MLPSATSLGYGLSREQVRVMVVENPRLARRQRSSALIRVTIVQFAWVTRNLPKPMERAKRSRRSCGSRRNMTRSWPAVICTTRKGSTLGGRTDDPGRQHTRTSAACPSAQPGVGLCQLNGAVERAQRTPSEEFYEVTECAWTVEALNRELRRCETIYNTVRPHQALGYLTPVQFLRRLSIVPPKRPSPSRMS